MPQLQHIPFNSPCFLLMNKVASDLKYNLHTLRYQKPKLVTLRYLVPPCVTCVPCGVEYDRSFHVFVVIDRFKILTHTHPTPLTQTSTPSIYRRRRVKIKLNFRRVSYRWSHITSCNFVHLDSSRWFMGLPSRSLSQKGQHY